MGWACVAGWHSSLYLCSLPQPCFIKQTQLVCSTALFACWLVGRFFVVVCNHSATFSLSVVCRVASGYISCNNQQVYEHPSGAVRSQPTANMIGCESVGQQA